MGQTRVASPEQKTDEGVGEQTEGEHWRGGVAIALTYTLTTLKTEIQVHLGEVKEEKEKPEGKTETSLTTGTRGTTLTKEMTTRSHEGEEED